MFSLLKRLFRGARREFCSPEWPAYAGVDWADTILNVTVQDRFFAKQGRTISRWTLSSGSNATRTNLVVYLKRHYELPRWHGLLAAFTPKQTWSPGWQEHEHLQIALTLGVPVPRVCAAAEYLNPGGRLQSMLAVEELTGAIGLHEAIPLASKRLSPADFARWKSGLIAEIVRLTRLMHDRAWFHKDLYLCHFYIAETDTHKVPTTWTGRLTMIDFHRLKRHPLTSPWWRAKDLGQLLYSSEIEGIVARDRVRFWKLYLAGRSSSFGLIRRIVLLRAHNHSQHNRRKPQAPPKAPPKAA